jgi:hypothetical protein
MTFTALPITSAGRFSPLGPVGISSIQFGLTRDDIVLNLGDLAVYNYSQPPHTGRLWYARHRWDPFHRARGEFTKPGRVCMAIVDYFEDWWRGPPALT